MNTGLRDDTIHSIQTILQQHPEVEEAVLYGSRAKGNFKASSDIDLVLRGNAINLSVLNRVALQLDDLLLPVTFDVIVFHQINNPDLIDHIQRVGVSLYKRSF